MTQRPWTIRRYEPGDEEGILNLFNEVFSEINPDFVHRQMDEWHWQFRDSPLGNQTTVAVEEGGRIIGQYTSIPFRTWLRGEEVVTSQIVDTCVIAEYRRTLKREGVFLSVSTRYFDEFAYGHPTVLCYGYPVPNAQRIGVRFLGYIPVLEPMHALCLNLDAGRVDALAVEGGDVETVPVERFGEDADRLWERLKPELQYSIFRNREFLNWRYADHPRVNYRLVEARRGGELVGVLAYRIGWINEKITPLVELFSHPEDRETQAALAAHAARDGLAQDHPRLELWLPPSGRWFAGFPALGFTREPTRFNLINRLFADWMNNDWLMEHYFCTMGDSDIY